MRRRACLWICGVALIVGALLLTDALLWQPGLTEGNVRRIKPGMTLAEVEALLGGPAQHTLDLHAEGRPVVRRGYRWQRAWKQGDDAVVVQFWEDNRVMAFAGGGQPQPGLLTRLRACLGL